MATITSAGIGSGLNVSELVGQLVAAERAPADNRLNTIETSTKAQISAFGSIKAALAGIESSLKKLDGAGGLPGRKATVATDAGFTASAGTSAALGSYSVIVEKLATAHKLQSAAATSTTQIGDGTLTLKVGDGDAFDVTIDAGKGTLADIRDAINSQAAGKGVSATLVNGDSGQVLVLYDMLGLYPRAPKFSKNFLAGRDGIEAAARAYVAAVKDGSFPAAEHSF